MTPFGHLSVSYISGKSIKNISLPAIIIGGVLPDIDFLFIFFDWFNQYHRVVTHNLFFIALVALIGSFLVSGNQRKIVAMSILLGGFSHLFIDSCMDANPTNGTGIALLWPLYKEFFAPFNILSPSGNKAGWGDPAKMIMPVLIAILYERPFYLRSGFLFFRKKRPDHL